MVPVQEDERLLVDDNKEGVNQLAGFEIEKRQESGR